MSDSISTSGAQGPELSTPSSHPRKKKARYLLRNLSRKTRSLCTFYNMTIREYIKNYKLTRYHKKRIPFIFLFGVPYHSNLGDQAQTYCIEAWIRKYMPHYGIHISMLTTSTDEKLNYIRQHFRKDDIILCHSGYHMTDLYKEQDVYLKLTQMFPDAPIRILPQTIHYLNEKNAMKTAAILNTHPNCTLLCRDEQSHHTAQSLFSGCHLFLYPDIVTSLIGNFPPHHPTERNGVLFCMRDDKEAFYSKKQVENIRQIVSHKHTTEMNDTTVDLEADYIADNRHQVLTETFKLFARYKVVVTDRYHGTIFSLIANTPVIVVNSTDHKLSSGVKWFPPSFRNHVYHASDISMVPQLVEEIVAKGELPQLPPYFVDNYYNGKLGEILNLPVHA